MRSAPALALALLGLAACGAPSGGAPATPKEEGPLVVLAASSLTGVLQDVGAAWRARGHGDVTFSFGATSRLAKQVEAGVPADAFFAADLAWMDELDHEGLLVPGTRATLAGNVLVAVVGADATFVPARPLDLAGPSVARLGLAAENVPAGRYAREALRSLGAWDAVEGRVVNGDDVRATLAWVAAGETDAGVVYATDAAAEPRVKVAFAFPPGSHAPIAYAAAALRASPRATEAARFLAFCRGPEAQAIFAAAGFLPAPA